MKIINIFNIKNDYIKYTIIYIFLNFGKTIISV